MKRRRKIEPEILVRSMTAFRSYHCESGGTPPKQMMHIKVQLELEREEIGGMGKRIG